MNNNDSEINWRAIYLVLMIPCGILKIASIESRSNTDNRTPPYHLERHIGIPQERISELIIQKKIDCSDEKYSGLCAKTPPENSDVKTLTLEDSVRCLGIGLALKRSAVEADKQTAYFNKKDAYFTKKAREAEEGTLTDQERAKIIKELERFEKQIGWINRVRERAKEAAKNTKICDSAMLHPDTTDEAVESFAVIEYNKIWK